MKKLLTTLLVLISLSGTALAQQQRQAEGGHDGNGGGGVVQNGQYMTFYSAGIYVNPIPKGMDSLPILNGLVRYITQSPHLTFPVKTRLLKALLPAQSRTYYDIRADKFGVDVKERLKAEYARATSADPNRIVVFAVTDTNAKKTYLLPEFYQLSAAGQMAILFHEAMWIIRPNSTYAQIIDAEVTFQAHIEQPQNFANAQRFVRLVGGISDEARFTYNWDRAQGVITADGRLSNGTNTMTLSFKNLLGSGTIPTLPQSHRSGSNDRLSYHLMNLSLSYPNSKFIEFLRDASMNDSVEFSTSINDSLRPTNEAYGNSQVWAATVFDQSDALISVADKELFYLTSTLQLERVVNIDTGRNQKRMNLSGYATANLYFGVRQ